MRRIADAGIAVVATIHQPSVAIFNDFDNLLLLKAGGETVFFGDLGKESCKLIEYLEGYDSTVPIKFGENPATWMLSCIGAGSAAIKDSFDYAKAYANSTLATDCIEKIVKYNDSPDERSVLLQRKLLDIYDVTNTASLVLILLQQQNHFPKQVCNFLQVPKIDSLQETQHSLLA